MKKLLKVSASALFLSVVSLNAYADKNDINQLQIDNQNDFSKFAEDFTNVFAYKSIIPAESLGLFGFDLGMTYTSANTKYRLSDQTPEDNQVGLYGIHLNKGLPSGFDIGLSYQMLEESDASSLTGELKYGLIEGDTLMPSLAISGHYTRVNGIDAFDMNNYGVDLGISKGILNFTPYAAIGWVSSRIDPNLNTDLKEENSSLYKVSAGVNINLFVFDISVGYNQIGDQDSYTIRAGYRF